MTPLDSLDPLRQRRLAERLRKSADTIQEPQSQMVGGHYIAPSAFGYLNKAVNDIGATMAERRAAEVEDAQMAAQAQHASEWRSSLPQAVAGARGMPANYVMESPEGQAGTPDTPAQPLTADRVLRHAIAAGANPMLKDEAAAYAKYGMMDVENRQKQEAAATEARLRREEAQAAAERAAVERGQQLAADRVAREERDARDAQLRKDLLTQRGAQQITIKGMGGGGDGFGGNAPEIGTDAADGATKVFRHAKTGKLFTYDDSGIAQPFGGKLGAKATNDKPLTEVQGNALLFGTRAAQAHNVLDEVGANYSPLKVEAARGVGGMPLIGTAANFALPEAEQKVLQAQRNFANAILRKESGAAISQSEFVNAQRQYFPMPGDTPGVIAQKKANRELAIKGLAAISGPKGGPAVAAEQANKPPVTVVRTGTRADGVRVQQMSDGSVREVQ